MSTYRPPTRRPALVLAFSLLLAAVGCSASLNGGGPGSAGTRGDASGDLSVSGSGGGAAAGDLAGRGGAGGVGCSASGGASAGGAAGNTGAGRGDAGSAATDAAETFPCGSASCASGREYCFSEEWDGFTKVAPECRALPAGCSTCNCAQSDAVSVSLACKGCKTLTCINRGVVIDYNTSSPTLSLACMVP